MKKAYFLFLVLASYGGTNTENPGATYTNAPAVAATTSLSSTVCSRIAVCFTGSNAATCEAQVMSVTGYTSQLGAAASSFSTLTALQTAIDAGTVQTNLTKLQSCEASISTLSCSDSLVTQSYSGATPNDYSATNLLF